MRQSVVWYAVCAFIFYCLLLVCLPEGLSVRVRKGCSFLLFCIYLYIN